MSQQSSAKTVLLFAGQGSHFPKMGSAAFEADPVFRDRLFYADRCVRRRTGVNLIETIFGPSEDWLNDIAVTHPAIFAQQWAAGESLKKRGVRVDACLGASLGEFVALVHTGAATFEHILDLIVGQASAASKILEPGGMMTVLAGAGFFHENPDIFKGCALAADNFERHIVVSGTRPSIEACRAALDKISVPAFLLNIPFGFHGPAVMAMRPGFDAIACEISLGGTACPVYGCSLAGERWYPDVENLWRIVEAPIHFSTTVSKVEADLNRPRYIDCSPSGTLATLLQYVLGPSERGRISALYSMGENSSPLSTGEQMAVNSTMAPQSAWHNVEKETELQGLSR
ncbi:acyltransferase domain-containing protein [Kordiimonas gwangyangensis]|uniref:acyltransferase domain-containing protein n=1 Tax=Kordiimonas gwangyangensis TaxID=288022 RepID=UPI00039FE12C|nr:acyltransferase domain-containing protein [Kordiimonas gwangyangensis]